MKSPLLAALLALGATPALAGAAPAPVSTHASRWSGNGTLYDRERHPISTYSLVVEIEPVSATEDRVAVKVDAADGSTFTQTCKLEKGDERWSKTCDDGGHGGGYAFAYGLAQDYYEKTDGTAYATTMVRDGETQMRLQRTELKDGEAVRFFAEELTLQRNDQ